jgi:hypothetical protein
MHRAGPDEHLVPHPIIDERNGRRIEEASIQHH